MASDVWHRLIHKLIRAAEDWERGRSTPAIASQYDSYRSFGGLPTVSDRQRAWFSSMPGIKGFERALNVISAIEASGPLAFRMMGERLKSISLEDIKPILIGILKDVALYVGGSTIVGAGIGGALGSLAFGVGAAPGAVGGAALGAEVGNLILTFTGLKSIVVYMKDAVPAACKEYILGFSKVWNATKSESAHGLASMSAKYDFARGHVLFIMALLMGIVAYLTRGKGNMQALLAEVRNSARLGPKMATWLEQNEDKLLNSPELRQSVRGAGGAGEAPAQPASNKPMPMRGQPAPSNTIVPEKMNIRGDASVTPSSAAADMTTPAPNVTGSAQSLYDQLPNKLKTKTVATDGTTNTISGYGSSLPDGYTYVSPSDVMQRAEDIGHDLKPAGAMDQGVPGQYNASHAEKQAIVNNPDAEQVDVSRDMCTDCQTYYQKEAIAQNRPITVSDPSAVRTFNPDGTVDSTPTATTDTPLTGE